MPISVEDEIKDLLNYIDESDRTIIILALENKDYNLARIISEGILFDTRDKFEEYLMKSDNFNYIMTNVLPLYKKNLRLDNLITSLNE